MIEHRRGATLSVTESEAEPVYETVDVQVRRIEEKQNTVKPHPEDRRGSPLQGALDSDISLDGYDQHLRSWETLSWLWGSRFCCHRLTAFRWPAFQRGSQWV